MHKLRVSVDLEMPQKKTEDDRFRELEERIDYAADCIECELPNAEQAKEFLTKLYFKMDSTPRQSQAFSRLQEKVYAILAPYGLDYTLKEDNNAKT